MNKHQFTATLEDGKRIVVRDSSGKKIDVEFAGTQDNLTVYAYVKGVGFIGGWQRRANAKRGYPWHYLVRAINMGIIWPSMNDLPKTM